MKNRKRKVWLLVAAILCGVGLSLAALSLASVGFDFDKLDTVEAIDGVYPIGDSFDSILINAESADIRFAVSEDDSVKVLTHERENARHSVGVYDGKLVIRVKELPWYEQIGDLYFGSEHITVLLPKGKSVSLMVETDTGDVMLPQGFAFGEVSIETDTGEVTVSSQVRGILKADTDTGNVTIQNTEVAAILIETDTGDVDLLSTRVSGTVGIETDTGEVTMKESMVTGDLYIETDTGDVTFKSADAANMDIKTNTGDVEGSLLSNKVFVVKTDTGDKKLPPSATEGTWCKIVTDTGDVTIRIAE